jgi:cytochrome oxidase Cu insertion factor (SCO1/SenC/PrrC family)
VLLIVAALGVWSLVARQPLTALLAAKTAARLPIYGVVPDFALIERQGTPVRLADLRGKIWIVDFIFTQCADACPLMSAEMARLQTELAPLTDLRLVSITIDPEHDTPAVLSRYAERFQADPQRWLFLTGDKPLIYRLAREGFRLGILDPADARPDGPGTEPAVKTAAGGPPDAAKPARMHRAPPLAGLVGLAPAAAFADHGRASPIGHPPRFVLVDRQARLRGYYDSQDEAALQRLRRHVYALAREP